MNVLHACHLIHFQNILSETWMQCCNAADNHCRFYFWDRKYRLKKTHFHLDSQVQFALSANDLHIPGTVVTSQSWECFNWPGTYCFLVKFSSGYLWPDKIAHTAQTLAWISRKTTSGHAGCSTLVPDILHWGTVETSLLMFNEWRLTALPHLSCA